jgi:hypothetical protein
MKYELRFEVEKETKNAVRYQEQPGVGKPAICGSLYVQKWALANDPARVLTVTVETVEG